MLGRKLGLSFVYLVEKVFSMSLEFPCAGNVLYYNILRWPSPGLFILMTWFRQQSQSWIQEENRFEVVFLTSTVNIGGYKGYAKFQEESDNDVGSDNDNYIVIKINSDIIA